ncbi:permease of phosphate ABC transporter [Flavonifractor sp. An92]|uniref:permease of phosphate ABC transporter n=1 Tax=Flavonifractor sp. An92 TaxID=1965666 RepID=UPI000B372C6A|nr:permease of phosphate ABC transporter [Flavonifractor sp. An92]OUN02141.1 permease of phosphate ABC transporter [Flavonifractor sp. An92]
MKKLFSAADACIAEMNWKDMALVKFCLCSMGMLLGLAVPKKGRKWAALGASILFVTTYLPLILKFLPALSRAMKGREE